MANRNPGWHGPEEERYVPPRKAKCVNGHDLTKDENVAVVKRKLKTGTVTVERQCRPCARRRWRESNAKRKGKS